MNSPKITHTLRSMFSLLKEFQLKGKFSARKGAGKSGKRRLATSVIAAILVGFSFVMLSGYYGRTANAAPLTATGFLSDSYLGATRGMRYLMSALFGTANSSAPNNALACTLTQQITVTGCYYTTGSKATVSVEVGWVGAVNGDTITVSLDSGAQTRTINPEQPIGGVTIATPQVVAFEINADGLSHTIASTLTGTNSCSTGADTFTAPASCVPNLCTAGELGGTIFFDFNGDGIRQAGEVLGVPNVTIKAYDASNSVVATATSNSEGRYEFSAANGNAIAAGSYPLRLEVTNLPGSGFMTTTRMGTDNGSSVQFVSSAQCGVDVSVLDQTGYCQNNPLMVVPCYVNGDPLANGTAATLDALVAFPYLSNGNPAGIIHLADASEVGSLWGVAYNKYSNKTFSSAILKRHIGLGPQGLGGIYVTDMTSFNTSNFIDVTALGINVGQASVSDNSTRGLPANRTQPNHDETVFSLIGKVGIGDLEISEDGNTLWFVNLNDKKLYSIDITAYNTSNTLPTAADVASTTIPSVQPCANGSSRPFATSVFQGKVYVGAVCDALGGTRSDLRASVFVYDPVGASWNTVFNFPLTYPKGYPISASRTGWYTWTDTFSDMVTGTSVDHPTPILADIVFDSDGTMVMGFADRSSLQTGYNNYGTNTASTALYSNFVGGDVLRAYFSNGSFVLENNAKAGPNTGFGANNNQGPGFGEFYNDNAACCHTEIFVGGLALKPGSGEVAAVAMDPNNPLVINTNGVRTLSNSTGNYVRNFAVYTGGTNTTTGTFGKATGLGDLELTCATVDILELGNRVWMDTNRNGIQDPDEMPMQGITVHLYQQGNSTAVATAVTDVNGNYRFTSVDADDNGTFDNDANLTDSVGLVGGAGLLQNTNYVIRFDSAADYQFGGVLYGKRISTANAGGGTYGTVADLRDSDASSGNNFSVPGGNFPEIVVQHLVNGTPTNGTGAYGEVDHTMDAGFYLDFDFGDAPDPTFPTLLASNGARHIIVDGVRLGATIDGENDGQPTANHDGDNNSGINDEDGVVIPTLIAGQNATIQVTASVAGRLNAWIDFNGNGNWNDAGERIFNDLAISAGVNNLTISVPLGATAGNTCTRFRFTTSTGMATTPTGQAADGEVEDYLAIIVKNISIGNQVFYDTNNNGVKDSGELGINGVTVELYADADMNGVPDTTFPLDRRTTATNGQAGMYLFTQQTLNTTTGATLGAPVNLNPGKYVICVPATMFSAGQPLAGLYSSRTTAGPIGTTSEIAPLDPNAGGAPANPGVDNDDNGLLTGGRICSGTIDVGNNEPLLENPYNNNDSVVPDSFSNLTVDFGFYGMSIGNLLFKDNGAGANYNNGIKDADENGIPGITVKLYAENGTTLLATTTTDANGKYLFPGLAAGKYYVEVDRTNPVLAGCTSSKDPANAGNPNAADNDDNGTLANVTATTIRSPQLMLVPGDATATGESDQAASALPGFGNPAATDNAATPDTNSDLKVDFGFVPIYSLGNRVWKDTDNSGTLNGAETGVDSVTVRLLVSPALTQAADINGVTVADQTTAGGGYYRFDNVPRGDYVVEVRASNFTAPGILTGCNSSAGGNDPDLDVDDNDDNGLGVTPDPVNGIRSAPVTLGDGNGATEPTTDNDPATNPQAGEAPNNQSDRTVDFGFVPAYSLGNRVWKDINNSGTIDGAETGVNGVVLRLLNSAGAQASDANGNLVADQTTSGGGYYRFDNLLAGDYTVEVRASNFTAPGALAGCVSSAGGNDPDTDVDDSDDNGLGIQPDPANGIRSAAVTLGPGVGTEPTGDNDPATNPQAGESPDNQSNRTVDFGFVPVFTLGNRVWKDLDNSGTINGAETGINGVVLRLLTSPGLVQATDINGTLVPDQTTANGGYYRFVNLPTGDYVIEVRASNFVVPGVLAGCVSSGPGGADPDTNPTDSDDNGVGTAPNPTDGIRSLPVTVGPQPGSEPTNETDLGPGDPAEPNGNTNQTVDFGFAPIFSLGNRVWKDTDNSGTLNGAETGVNGVVIRLLSSPALTQATDVAGVLVPDQTTANGGYYRFDNLPSGDYVVEVRSSNFTTPGTLAGCVSSLADAGDPDTDVDDSDDNGVGVVPGANGIRSLPVTLGPQPGSEPTTETDRGPGDPAEPNGATNLTLDFGFAPIYSLGNRVWKDTDNSGTINGAEVGVNGVVLRLLTSPGLTQATDMNGVLVPDQTTANGGYYRFDNILGGNYVVEVRSSNFTAPGALAGCVSVLTDETNPNNDVDSNDNGIGVTPGANGIRSNPVTLGPQPGSEPTNETDRSPSDPAEPNGATNLTVDFGFAPIYSLGNRVWKDTDNSGTINGAEVGVNGVVLRLLTSPGLVQATDATGALVADQTTANGGYYRFDNILAGDYVVEVRSSNFTAPGALAGCVSVLSDAGDPDTDVDDSDDNGVGVVPGANGIRSLPITLGPQPGSEPINETDRGPSDPAEPNGNTNLTLDFGFAPIYSLGNRIWKDINNSGTIDAADGASPGVNGVVVRLLTSPGLTQATDMNGALVADQTTANGGYYRFDNILGGNYVVEVRSSNFTAPGTLAGCVSVLTDETNPDNNVDSNDNGIGVSPGANGIRSNPVTLGPQPGSEPTNETDRSPSDPAEPNGATNLTVDFGFAPIFSLGNRVWKDLDNSGTINGAEVGINGVVVRLLTSPGLVQATDMNGALVPDQTTANGGYYRFDNILGGDYVVEVRSTNFTSPGVLTGCVTSTGTNGLVGATGPNEPAPDADANPADSDDNGESVAGAVRSKPVTLGLAPGSEPTNETDRSPSDPAEPNGATNLTVDFGFTTPMNVGNLVWKDLNLNGLRDGNPLEPGIDGVKVVLWADNGDGVFNSTTDTMLTMVNTSGGGTYSFTNILPGNYFVVVDQSNFGGANVLGSCLSSFGVDTGDQVDNNDNGVDNQTPATSGVASSLINLTDGAEPTNDGDGPNGNLTIDFGFIFPSDFAFGGAPGSGIPGKVYEGDACNGATGAYVLTFHNNGPAAAIPGAVLTDVIPTGITPLSVSGSAGWSCSIAGQTVTCTSTASFAVNAVAQFRIAVAIGYKISGSVTNTATIAYAGDPVNPNNSASTTINVVNGVGAPGQAFENNGSSVLVYPIYTSSASSPNEQNTRINLTNIQDQKSICVHLFFVDGASCSVADSIVCLTPNQTTSFLASDLDPGSTGYIVAVAIDCNGCPANFNFLVGDEFVKFASGHRGNVIAEGVAALPGLPACDNNSVIAELKFDGVQYGRFGRVLAMDNFGSRADGNDTMMIVDRIGGNLGIGASTLGTLFGILYDDSEAGVSFNVTGQCQLRSSLSNNFPRTTPRFETFVPAGRTGWLKLFSQSDVALVGASINYNANSTAQLGAFSGAHNLHKLTLSSAGSYIIPVFPAQGCQ